MATGGIIADMNNLSDETFDFLCTMCKNDGKNTEAVKYCTDCCDYYCVRCINVHNTVPALKQHKIVDQGQFRKGSGNQLPMIPTERCEKHGLKPVDMYCENHDTVGCPTCMTVSHRLCQDIVYIPEYIQTKPSKVNPQDIQRKLDATENTLSDSLRLFEQEKQAVIEKRTRSIQQIQNFRKNINQRLDLLEKASIAEIEIKYKETIIKIENAIHHILESKAEVSIAQTKLTNAANNESQAFVGTTVGRTTVKNAENCLAEQKAAHHREEYSFGPKPKLSALLKELKTLRHIAQEECKNANKQGRLLKIKGKKNYLLTDPADRSRSSHIFSSCILEDGTVMLAVYINNCLLRLTKSIYSVRDQFGLPGQPWQVCTISNSEVAVSYQRKEIMFISAGYKMTQKSIIKTDFQCHALAYAEGNIYVSDRKGSVYMYTVLGEKLKQLSLDNSGHPLFSSSHSNQIQSLAVSIDGSMIYIADSEKGLIALDKNGKVLWQYNEPVLERVTEVCVTSCGDVLVCGTCSNNILQLKQNGELIGEVLKSYSITGIRTVCCQGMSKMILSREYMNEIEVYDLA